MDGTPSYEQLTQRVRELEAALAERDERHSSANCAPESEDHCRQMIENLSELIIRFSPNGTIKFVNTAVCHHFDIPAEKMTGSSLFDFIPPEDHTDTRRFLGTFTLQNRIGLMEHRMITAKEEFRWFQCNYCAIFDDSGCLSEYQSVGRDVTDKKNTEMALKKSESKYRTIMDAMQDGVYVCSPASRIEYMNRAMIDRIGRDATGEACHKAIYDADEKCLWCVFDRVAQGEQVNGEHETPGDNRYYSVSSTPIHFSEGNVSKLTIFRDLTELKSVEERLRQSEKMASLAQLTGGIAHDFNNILMSINGYTELLLYKLPVDSEARENLNQVLFAGHRARRLIHQLVQFIRPEESVTSILDPVPVVADVVNFMRSGLPATVDIRQELSSINPVIMDQEQLSRIVMNLCTNAAHAMEETGGVVTVSMADTHLSGSEMVDHYSISQGDYVELKVSDTGHGMGPQTIKRIFDPYFTTKDKSKGAGLGLSIVHGIVSGIKGAIRVRSQPGKGTTFQVLIPAAAPSSSPPEIASIGEASLPSGQGERILFVDDEPALVELGRKRLEILGYQVVTETDPEAALTKFSEQPDAFSLVITDVTMPRLTGDKLAKAMATIRPGVPIILCSGYHQMIDEKTSKKLGIKAILKKPITIEALAEVVDRTLKGE